MGYMWKGRGDKEEKGKGKCQVQWGRQFVSYLYTMVNTLRYPDEDIEGHGFPVFDHGDFERFSLLSPYTKFKIVASSTTATSSYVHIQSAYNNKYWVRSTNDNSWIWAGADEINEDQTAWNCTFFEILNTNEKPNYVRIRHLQLGCYLSLWTASVFYKYGLFANSPNIRDDERDQVEWTDTGSYFVLPKFIAFKNSASGAYLTAKSSTDKIIFSSHPPISKMKL